MKKTFDVFISYSSKDKKIADDICQNLERNNISCWIAPRNVRYGEPYAREIIQGIKNCNIMLLVYTKNSNESEHVENEIDIAFNEGKTIIPFIVDEIEMKEEFKYYLSRKHWFVAYPNYSQKFNLLASSILSFLNEIKDKDTIDNQTNTHPNNIQQTSKENILPKKIKLPKIINSFASSLNKIIFFIDCIFNTLWLICVINNTYNPVSALFFIGLAFFRLNLSYLIFKAYKQAWVSLLISTILYSVLILTNEQVQSAMIDMCQYPIILLIGIIAPDEYYSLSLQDIDFSKINILITNLFIFIILPIIWYIFKLIFKQSTFLIKRKTDYAYGFIKKSRIAKQIFIILLLIIFLQIISFYSPIISSKTPLILLISHSILFYLIPNHKCYKQKFKYLFIVILISLFQYKLVNTTEYEYNISLFITTLLIIYICYIQNKFTRNKLITTTCFFLHIFIIPFFTFGFNPYVCRDTRIHRNLYHDRPGVYISSNKQGQIKLRDRYGYITEPSYHVTNIFDDPYIELSKWNGDEEITGIYNLRDKKFILYPTKGTISTQKNIYKIQYKDTNDCKYFSIDKDNYTSEDSIHYYENIIIDNLFYKDSTFWYN